MPKLHSSDHIIAMLLHYGFIETGQTGSHRKFRKGARVVVVPHPRKEIPAGTFASILRQSSLSRIDFEMKH
jgi:predicted RNA binding protein YcfA (HicA-like mRNA interferase family)